MEQTTCCSDNISLEKQGLLFIPDISGYTRFVKDSDLLTGRQICLELLSTIVAENSLGMDVLEIEGDAVLFFKAGQLPSPAAILHQYEQMLEAFHDRMNALKKRFSLNLDFSLKAVAHYGTIATYNLAGFCKIYGPAVIEVHRLLKNSIQSDQYILFTEALLNTCNAGIIPQAENVSITGQLCESYGELKNICFCYLDYSSQKQRLPHFTYF